MSRKIRFISLLTLLICFLMGCSLFQKNGGGPGEQGSQFSESVRKLREKYSKNTPYDVQEKVIQIKENEPITFPTEVQKPNDFETLPHAGQTELISSFEIYGDSNKTENEYLLLAMDNPLYAQSHYAFDRYEDAIKE